MLAMCYKNHTVYFRHGLMAPLIKEQKSREIREQLRSFETREVPYTCKYIMETL